MKKMNLLGGSDASTSEGSRDTARDFSKSLYFPLEQGGVRVMSIASNGSLVVEDDHSLDGTAMVSHKFPKDWDLREFGEPNAMQGYFGKFRVSPYVEGYYLDLMIAMGLGHVESFFLRNFKDGDIATACVEHADVLMKALDLVIEGMHLTKVVHKVDKAETMQGKRIDLPLYVFEGNEGDLGLSCVRDGERFEPLTFAFVLDPFGAARYALHRDEGQYTTIQRREKAGELGGEMMFYSAKPSDQSGYLWDLRGDDHLLLEDDDAAMEDDDY